MFVTYKNFSIAKNKATQFFYLGVSSENLFSLQKNGILISLIAEERREILQKIRGDLINLDKNIPDVSDPLWLASDLAENNICLENFTLYILNTLVIIKKGLLKEKEAIFICDDDEQVFIYKSILKRNSVNIFGKVSYFLLLRRFLGCFFQKLRNFYQGIYKIFTLRALRYWHRAKLEKKNLENIDILVVNWVNAFSFKNGNLTERDRYFGDLFSYLTKKGEKIEVIGKPLQLIETFKEIVKSAIYQKRQFYFLQDFLKLTNLIKIFFQSFGILKYFNCQFVIEDVDFSPLWQWWCLKEAFKPRISSALETFYAMRDLCKEIKNPHIKLLYPYENQPWEKVLSLAFAESFTQKNIYSYQHFPISKDYLTIYPSKAYLRKKINPRIILSDCFFENYLKEEKCENNILLGNFRFKSILESPHKSIPRKNDTVLCACSIQFNDSLELIIKSLKIIKNLEQNLRRKIPLIVNFHPLMSAFEKKKIQENFSNVDIHWSPSRADEILESVRIVFYNSNSICLNAAAKGIPAMFIRSDLQIDLDRIRDTSLQDDMAGIKKIETILNDEACYMLESNRFRKYFESYFVPLQYSKLNEIFK